MRESHKTNKIFIIQTEVTIHLIQDLIYINAITFSALIGCIWGDFYAIFIQLFFSKPLLCPSDRLSIDCFYENKTPKITKEATKFGLKLLWGKQLRYKFLVDFLSHVYIILQMSYDRLDISLQWSNYQLLHSKANMDWLDINVANVNCN